MRATTIPAALLAVSLLLPASPSPAGGKPEAQVRFEKGVSLFKAGDFGGALVEFKAAYEAQPNFKVRYNIGMALFNLHRYVDAQVELQAYLTEGSKDVPADKKTEVQSLLFEIGSYIGTLLVMSSAQGAILTMDGIQVGPLPLSEPLSVDVGEHVIAVEAPGYLSWSQKVSVAGGKQVSVDASLTPSTLATQPGALIPVPTGTNGTEPVQQPVTSGSPPAAGPCSAESDCPPSQGCHGGECMSRQKWANLKYHGKNLIVPGWILFGIGIPLTIVGGIFGKDARFIAMAVVGALSFFSSIPLLAVGYRYRKLAWKKKIALLDTPPLPWVAPVEGGLVIGIIASF